MLFQLRAKHDKTIYINSWILNLNNLFPFFITNMKYIDESICEVNIENNKKNWSKTCKKKLFRLNWFGFSQETKSKKIKYYHCLPSNG